MIRIPYLACEPRAGSLSTVLRPRASAEAAAPHAAPPRDERTPESERGAEAARRHLRGSGVLFVGRSLSKWLNFAAQVLLVRCLTQTDYGALAYALAVVAVLAQVSTFGLHQSITRFLPIYQEQGRHGRWCGAIAIALGVVLTIGIALAAGIFAGRTALRAWIDPQALELLLVLALFAPLQAVDNVLLGMFAVLGRPTTIFFRRHLLAPGLKLGVLAVAAFAGLGVWGVAVGFLAAEVLGVFVGLGLLRSELRRGPWTQSIGWRRWNFPWREMLAFTTPLVLADLIVVALPTLNLVLLERFADVKSVAMFRAMAPLALMIDMVRASFTPLFMPSAARLLARNDFAGVSQLYWQSTLWLTVLAFPVFLLTFATARPVAVLLYGERYADAAPVLSLLALGIYWETAWGFNALVLKVYAHWRYLLSVNACMLLLGAGAGWVLIPKYGAIGAAAATCGTMFVSTLLNQASLRAAVGVRFWEPRFLPIQLRVVSTTLAVGLLQWTAAPPLPVMVAVIVAAFWWLLRRSSGLLQLQQVYPELEHADWLRRLLAIKAKGVADSSN